MMDDGYESGLSCRIAQAEPATKREEKEKKNCDSRRHQTVKVPDILYSVGVWPVLCTVEKIKYQISNILFHPQT